MWWTALIGALLGTVKANEESKKYQQQTELESIRARWSPWTGTGARDVGTGPSIMNRVQEGFSAGAMMGQNMGGSQQGTSNWGK